MNWTSTRVPLWQVDCENFRRTMRPFELRNVETAEHEEFIEHFTARYGLTAQRQGATVVFEMGSTD